MHSKKSVYTREQIACIYICVLILIYIVHFVIILSVLYEDNFILATDRIHDRIIQVDLESGHFVKLPVKADGVTGIAYEKSTDTIFFTTAKDLSTAKVGSISLHGDRDPVTYATGNTSVNLYKGRSICFVYCMVFRKHSSQIVK